MSYRFLVNSLLLLKIVQHPVWKIVRTSAMCPNESLNTVNCSSYTWRSVTTISYIGVNITGYGHSTEVTMEIIDVSGWLKRVIIRLVGI